MHTGKEPTNQWTADMVPFSRAPVTKSAGSHALPSESVAFCMSTVGMAATAWGLGWALCAILRAEQDRWLLSAMDVESFAAHFTSCIAGCGRAASGVAGLYCLLR